MLLSGFPAPTTVQRWFYSWCDDVAWERINHCVVQDARLAQDSDASPSANVINSQSVKTADRRGVRDYDVGKRVKGRKRNIIADTAGYVVHAIVIAADISDRDGTPLVLADIRSSFPWLRHVLPMAAMPEAKALAKIVTGPLRSSNVPII